MDHAISDERTVVNVATRLSQYARRQPQQIAVVETSGQRGRPRYRSITFANLDADSNRIASGLRKSGITAGTRIALLVRPGIDFVALVFGLFKCGAVVILIDPGTGRRNMVRCLAEAKPEGFIAIPAAQAIRTLLRHRFPKSKLQVTLGPRWFWSGLTLNQLRQRGSDEPFEVNTCGEDPAAIIFTTGSTGPPKGVLYCHRNFDEQVVQIQRQYQIEPGTIDVAAFPLFALFNSGMGGTTVFPKMDFARPADVDPVTFISVINDWNATQSFGSPALWNRIGRYCEKHDVTLATLKRVLSAGAPVPGGVLKRLTARLSPTAEMHTPYGATEALPIATISAGEILSDTQEQTDRGSGVCVGKRFDGIRWKVIRIVDESIATLSDVDEVPQGEIGELIVKGPVVTRQYVTRTEANSLGKIHEAVDVWHRMGDVGYLDDRERFWFCGRMAHRVRTADMTLYTVRCEGIFNTHGDVFRSALVGVGDVGRQRPVIIVELHDKNIHGRSQDWKRIESELRNLASNYEQTAAITAFLLHPSLPVDIRHNSKIFREKLGPWAAGQIQRTAC